MHNPFTSLEKNPKLRAKFQRVSEHPPQPRPAMTPPKALDEEELFLKAMAGVQPMNKSGRDVTRSTPVTTKKISSPPTFKELLQDNIEFEMEYTREYILGQIKGLDAKIFRKLKSGHYSVQAHLDLHGMNALQAKSAVQEFIKHNYLQGKRCVLLIPGRGRNSPRGQGVLRQEVSTWLTQAPLKRIILAFCTAQPKHGGSGAIYLLLRQAKKAKGKILWTDIFIDLEG